MKRRPRYLLAGWLLSVSSGVGATPLVAFTTDGCSLFPDGTAAEPQRWQACCVRHDEAYYLGGTRSERAAADLALRDCVAKVCSSRVGELMWSGVTLGGSPVFATPWRWGYAWSGSGMADYREVSPDERQAALTEIDRFWANGGRVAGFVERRRAWHGILAALPGVRRQFDALSQQLNQLGLRCDGTEQSNFRADVSTERPLVEELIHGDGS